MKQKYWYSALALAFAACPAPTLPGDPPSGYEFETPPPPPPTDAALIAAQLDTVLLEVFALDPVELFQSFEGQLALGEAPTAVEPPEGEENCPQYDIDRLNDPADGFLAWSAQGTCDSDLSTARFQGDGESRRRENFLEDAADPNSAFIIQELSMGSTSRIFEDRAVNAGPRFDIAMGMDYVEAVPTQGSTDIGTFANFDGTAFWNGTGSGAVWLSQRYSLDFEVSSQVIGANKQVFIRGIVSGLQNPLIDAIIFNDVEMTLATFPDPNDPNIILSTCQLEPAGSFELRDTNGYWYRLSFQGSRDFDDEAGGQCDGSGDLIIINDPFNPQITQPVTPTFTGLSDWGGRPWR
jgi:hypothetical protein